MRTTVTLDDDVAALLKRRQRETGRGFRDTLNDALRSALAGPRAAAALPVRLPTLALGALLVPDIDDVSEAIDLGEGPWHG